MSQSKVKLPEILEAEQTPLVQTLPRLIAEQLERIEELEAGVKRLKALKGKPKLKSRAGWMRRPTGKGKAERERTANPAPSGRKPGS